MANRLKGAFIVMGEKYTYKKDNVHMENDIDYSTLFGVANVDEACELAAILLTEGYKCISLCGAFGEDDTRAIIAASQGKIAVSYCIHLPEQDKLFSEIFG